MPQTLKLFAVLQGITVEQSVANIGDGCRMGVLSWDLHVFCLACPDHSALGIIAERGKGGKSPCSGNLIAQ